MIRFAVPPIGGKGWFGGWMYMANLVRALAEHGDAGIETLLFLGQDRAGDPLATELGALPRTRVVIDAAFDEDRVRAGAGRALVTGRNAPLLATLAREGVDVAFAPAIFLGRRSDVASIAWFPDFQHRCLPDMFSRGAWWRREIGFRAQVRNSALVLLSSEDAEADCLRFYPASRGRTRVARFAVPIEGWPDAAEAAAIRAEAGLPEDYVFLPNQLWLHKNHGLAIRAAAVLKARGIARPILVSGRGHDPRRPHYPAELDALIAELGVGDRVRMLGSVDHRLVKALTIGANALLNPSRFEGWSTTVEEAKGCGTPMLLSDIPVHREQAPDARFFPTDDAEALADAIAGAGPRSLAAVETALAATREAAIGRQRAFAQAVARAIREAAQAG